MNIVITKKRLRFVGRVINTPNNGIHVSFISVLCNKKRSPENTKKHH